MTLSFTPQPLELRKYAHGTYLRVQMPWSTYVGGKAVCADGTLRTLCRISQTADTFFSIPAAVKVRGKTVSGYVSFEHDNSDPPQLYVSFKAYEKGENYRCLPNDYMSIPRHSQNNQPDQVSIHKESTCVGT